MIDQSIEDGTPPEQIVVGGFSQGGAVALGSVLSYPKTLGGSVCWSGWMVGALNGNFAKKVHEANKATPVFWGHGAADGVVTPENQTVGVPLLKDNGNPVTVGTYPGMAHSACEKETDALADFLTGLFAA